MHRREIPWLTLAFGLLGVLPGCGGGGTTTREPDAVAPTIALEFTRVTNAGGLDPVQVTVRVSNSTDTPVVTSTRGRVGTVTSSGGGVFSAVVTPATTGEHQIEASVGGAGGDTASATRTALVLQDVDAGWGQPESVRGLVNTSGYEDGVTIAPDGKHLFVQYGPMRWAGLLIFNEPRANGGCGGDRLSPDRCTHDWIDTAIGPMVAPERPGFVTSRFSGDTVLHNAGSWGVGVEQSPVVALPTMFYGFARQDDGTFAEPFTLAFDDLGDGIIGPFGLSFLPLGNGLYRAIFALKDTLTTDAGFDVYTCDVTFGVDNVLGAYEATGIGVPPTRAAGFASTLVDLGDNRGTQGNPFLYATEAGEVLSIWTDDEYDEDADTGMITAHVLRSGVFPESNDFANVLLPSVVNVPGTEAIQPTFTEDGLWFTQDVSVVFAAYSGMHGATELGTASNWSAPTNILQKDTSVAGLAVTEDDLGKVIAIGEPTLSEVDGVQRLYFVYAWVRAIDPVTGLPDLDFQAGVVQKR